MLFIIIISIVIVVFVAKTQIFNNQSTKGNIRPGKTQKPTILKNNDKVILVKNVNKDEIKKALAAFCNMYNNDDFVALPRLWELSPASFAVSFPYDIDFMTFCFAVNFLKYPTTTKWNAEIRAWATTQPGDELIANESMHKKAMLFIAADDKEYDNVFLTTRDNIGYKLAFSARKPKPALPIPKEYYISPSINTDELINQPFEDFE